MKYKEAPQYSNLTNLINKILQKRRFALAVSKLRHPYISLTCGVLFLFFFQIYININFVANIKDLTYKLIWFFFFCSTLRNKFFFEILRIEEAVCFFFLSKEYA